MNNFNGSDKVSDHYDQNDDFGDNLNHFIPGFEYPNWSHRTIKEVLNAVSEQHASIIVDSLNGIKKDNQLGQESNVLIHATPVLVNGVNHLEPIVGDIYINTSGHSMTVSKVNVDMRKDESGYIEFENGIVSDLAYLAYMKPIANLSNNFVLGVSDKYDQSYLKAEEIAGQRDGWILAYPKEVRKFEGRILGVTDLHVVQNLGKTSVIHEKCNLDREVAQDAMASIAYPGKGRGVITILEQEKKVER